MTPETEELAALEAAAVDYRFRKCRYRLGDKTFRSRTYMYTYRMLLEELKRLSEADLQLPVRLNNMEYPHVTGVSYCIDASPEQRELGLTEGCPLLETSNE